ncbi:1-deoxyxylulose-5-phosphate synthase, thiamine-requiring, FAD-requiring [uncultured delta proteobacterium]|uniref:1-deoxy-D-xylulose-5-phosphate synthase n=1 Tax=uncultured delta proteobacterium TaxID=34034 RepID=A0A212J0P0_9DELT|nr:1-deoxyxylulose-5-phosphate synthase, thiamine-requiring, FAD-requiring [uncultured delta proteobacterium]
MPSQTPLLDAIKHPTDVAALTYEETAALASELRQVIVETVSCTGGHLAPSLGVVELTLALLRMFNPEKDHLIWDVGHQAYAYKLLTGRAKEFHTLRQFGGLAGFPSPRESKYDHFGVGHSSTSISAALGMAFARDLALDDNHVIAVIGDGSMTAGQAYEGLNQAGATGKKLIVVLNDNEMSISKNVGALSFFLSRSLSVPWVRHAKRELEEFITAIPKVGGDLRELIVKAQQSLKGFVTPGMLFEALRFNYIGPVSGHNLEELTKALETAKEVDKPTLVHVLTIKGKGYAPAEENPVHFHGVGKFSPETGVCVMTQPGSHPPSYTEIFGATLTEMAEKNDRIVAITAAMPEGTGLSRFGEKFPDRFVDVGICEQHAVTFAAGLAARGYRPFVAIYSTFLQRSYDQIVHDVCLQNLPVVFCIDRAGIVGEDGATHQGVFDIAFLRHIPNMSILVPKDEEELRRALLTASIHDGPIAVRYPRGQGIGAALPATWDALPPNAMECLSQNGAEAAIIGLGPIVHSALAAANAYTAETGIPVDVYNARWAKPLPKEELLALAASYKTLILAEEGALMGGFGSGVLECLADAGALPGLAVHRIGLPDIFIEHGAAALLRQKYGLDVTSITDTLRVTLSKSEKKR